MNRQFAFVKVACALFEVQVGEPMANAKAITALLEQADKEQLDVLLFPELALTGYTCGDLFLQSHLLDKAEQALQEVLNAAQSLCPQTLICLGLPVRQHGVLFNAAVLIQGRKILGLVPKSFVPNSQEFYEKRWFAPAKARTQNHCVLCAQEVPFTPDLIVETEVGLRIACEVCEDLWVNMPPSSRHTLMGANLILNPSASNEVATKARYRRDLLRLHSGRCLCAYAYASSGPGESTTDLVFSGHCLIASNGVLLAESKEQEGFTVAVLDLEKLANDRLKNASAQHVGVAHARDYTFVKALDPSENNLLPEKVEAYPFVPKGNELEERCREILHLQAQGLAWRIKKTGVRCVVIGISGGLDSTLALLVAVAACDRMHLPRSFVLGVTMPGFGTTDHTRNNAEELMRLLGVRMQKVDIKAACLQHFKDIGQEADCYDVTFENSQARERTQILMDLANKENGLVVGTGDMSELALGWATYNGDHMSMYGVNAGVPKTLVRFLVEEYGTMHTDVQAVLQSICATEISPELLPPDAQGKRQSTEGTIGKYDLHDFFLFNFVRNGFSKEKIQVLAEIAFPDLDKNIIANTLATFFRRFYTQQFKRSCLPDGPKVGTVSLSPRGDWRMPSDVRYPL